MRTVIRVGLAAIILAVVGCVAPGKKPDAPSGAGQPFTGASLTRPTTREPTPPPEVDNLLAGQVLDKTFNKRVSNASIQVVDLQDPNAAPAARLDVSASNDGYFFIPGLQRGHHYQLIARIKDGNRILSGTTLAMPPNPRLSIYLSEDFTTPSTPAPMAPPAPITKPPPEKTPGAPSAALDPPTRIKPDGPVDPAGPPQPALNKIADETGSEPGGFHKIQTPATVDIPSAPPNPLIPPPPPFTPSGPPAAPAPPQQPSVEQAGRQGPPPRTAPPFCVLVGNRLDDFALMSTDGKPWEFRRDPPRKLVLLDFWKTPCSPCLGAIAHLRGLQDAYRRDGLEVVGVAYEDPAPLADQIMNIRKTRSRFNINYTTLLGADSAAGPCPVRSQFMVDSFPRLVLIDESGELLWRSSPEGLSDDQYRELAKVIDYKLHPPGR